jgi:hypothetical protein
MRPGVLTERATTVSYPWIVNSGLPSVSYSVDKNGTHLVTFYEETDGVTASATIRADVVLAVAFRMCEDHVDTEWAKRHLESKGYVVKKRKSGYLAQMLGV